MAASRLRYGTMELRWVKCVSCATNCQWLAGCKQTGVLVRSVLTGVVSFNLFIIIYNSLFQLIFQRCVIVQYR